MRKIFQYILMAVAVITTASCSNEQEELMQPANNGDLQFIVGEFPAFGEGPETRTIGNTDKGKTAWEEGDELLVSITFDSGKKEAISLEYKAGEWTPNGKLFARSTITEAIAVYAPDCEIGQDGSIGLKEGKRYGLEEYIPAKATLEGNTLTVTFYNVNRTYSRLRIVGLAGEAYTVNTTNGFTPAGATSEATEPYTLTADDKGNAYLYGTFAEGATVIVNQGDFCFAYYTFTEATKATSGYALEARPVVGVELENKTQATEDDINIMVVEIKYFVDYGISTIVVTGSKPATIDWYGLTKTAIGAAIYRLSDEGNYLADNPYHGKVDLILPDVTEIINSDFNMARTLNSITLPKVTKLGDAAFFGCWNLKTITFGSVLTEVNETLVGSIFADVGFEVDGCDLFINC